MNLLKVDNPRAEVPMVLGEVIGAVVASQVYDGLVGQKFLIVQPMESNGDSIGDPVVAVDTVMAGPGDRVFMVLSREAALALEPWFVPVDHAIVGIVDHVYREDD
jgi:microcompartment protein CcmK/EutM